MRVALLKSNMTLDELARRGGIMERRVIIGRNAFWSWASCPLIRAENAVIPATFMTGSDVKVLLHHGLLVATLYRDGEPVMVRRHDLTTGMINAATLENAR